ncbi:hypothetical protein J31TS3_36020 [Paenibacillus lactis]|nr:hypothetical protein J31TS3_36020 [Paenibacillus lactis]
MGSLRFEGLTTLPLPCILQYVDVIANTIIYDDHVVKNRFESVTVNYAPAKELKYLFADGRYIKINAAITEAK